MYQLIFLSFFFNLFFFDARIIGKKNKKNGEETKLSFLINFELS